jgi:hypothetical protein
MLIGLVVVTIVAPQVDIVFFLVITLTLGVAGNNKLLLGQVLKPNTRP